MQLSDMWVEIDKQSDPKGSVQYIPREPGEPREKLPPRTKTLDGRARRWMVDVAWLKANIDADEPGRLAESGIAWGDREDPEDTEVRLQKAANDNKEDKKRKRGAESDEDEDSDSTKKKKSKKSRSKKAQREKKDKSDKISDTPDGNDEGEEFI
jgi:hypothetical protein